MALLSGTTDITQSPVTVSVTGQNLTGPTTIQSTVDLGTLANSTTTITLQPSSVPTIVQIDDLLGNNTISNLTSDDVLNIVGERATLSGNTLTTGTGTVQLADAPAGSHYAVFTDSNGNTEVVTQPNTVDIYRFFDSTNGTQFYTGDPNERSVLQTTRSDLVPEGPGGVGLTAVDPNSNDPNAVPVFRFFDTRLGTHFFTASALERDAVAASRSDLVFEAGNEFYEHATQQLGDVPVYRFFDSMHGTHFYTDDPVEQASIMQNRPDLVAEGIGFYEPGKSS